MERTGRVEARSLSPTRSAASAPSGRPDHAREVPLVVGLDGTLVRGHVARDAALGLLWRAPRGLAALARGWREGGRAGAKARLAALAPIDPAVLPYRAETLALIREARAAGRPVLLVTAADRSVAEAVAGHLGVFDDVHASDGRRELTGEAKAALLTERYGAAGFDHVGDSSRDLPVWAAARQCLTVGAGAGLARAVERLAEARAAADGRGAPPVHLAPPPDGAERLGAWLEALQPEQWLKNGLVMLPVLAAHRVDWGSWSAAMTTFLAFCLVASAAYLTTDVFDLDGNRADPRRRGRPFASGALNPRAGALAIPLLLGAGLAVAWQVSALLFGVMVFHYGASTFYALVLRREMVIDICARAGLYAMRVIAGTVAIGILPTPWMLALSGFLFLSIAATARLSELVTLARRESEAGGGAEPETARQRAGRAYRSEDRPIVTMMAIASGYTAVLVLSLYIYSPGVRVLYSSPIFLWAAPVFLVYWLSRVVLLTHRGEIEEDPLLFALRDPASFVCAAGVLGSAIVANAV